jgi:flavin-binding protein dodecin
MSVAKILEIKSSSVKSFDDAIKDGLAKASKTIDNLQGAWIGEQEVLVDSDGKVKEYRVLMKVTFLVKE